jgi:diphosphomevalonate decarboxylase
VSPASVRRKVVFRASPSLALIKYWGKADPVLNTPATPSIAVTLGGLSSTTEVVAAEEDSVTVDGEKADVERYRGYFETLRSTLATTIRFGATSRNDFATSAGLASSASGFAALTCACARLAGSDADTATLSAIARAGSASAARSLFGGFTALEAGATAAIPLYPADYWNEFRVVIVELTAAKKPVSSREAMERAKSTSPYYDRWVDEAPRLFREALSALERRDLEALGELMRASYLAMFSTMFTSRPPVIYWLPESLEVIHECAALRSRGIGAWETMDAGPQVKIATTAASVDAVVAAVGLPDAGGTRRITVASPGGAPSLVAEE